MTRPRFRVGLVGAGYISEYHVAALRRLADVEIVGVADLDAARARGLADRLALEAFPSLGALAERGVDVVHVLTPPSSHAAVAVEALSLGRHVFVEKPLATSVEECDEIAAAAEKAGRQVCVGHSLLYDYFVLKVLATIRRGTLGRIVSAQYLRSSNYPPYPGGPLPPQYREGGYPFRDLGVHGLYLMREILGEIEDVQASFSTGGGDPNLYYDEWSAQLRCRRGLGQLQLSWNVRPLQSLLVVQGTKGILRADLFSMWTSLKRTTPLPKSIERAYAALSEPVQAAGQVLANLARVAGGRIRPYHGLQGLVADFYASLAAGRPVPVGVADARPVVEWTEKMARPADEAKRLHVKRFTGAATAPVLVTGASGFLGGRLLERMRKQGARVRVLVRRDPPEGLLRDDRVEVFRGDLGDPEAVDRAVAGCEIVYHVGAAMSGSADDFERGTVAGTRNVVESALRHHVAGLVYVSSLGVLHASRARPGDVVREDWPLEPHPEQRGVYTSSKLRAEAIVREAVRGRGLPAVILRPGQVFGPGGPLVTGAVAFDVGNRLWMLGDGEVVLPLVYVEDVVDALLAAGQRRVFDGTVLHLVDGARVSQNELVRRYFAGTASRKRLVHVPRASVDLLALGIELVARLARRSPPLSRYRVSSALAPLVHDCTAAERVLGWRPRVGVDEGLKATLTAIAARATDDAGPPS